MLSRVRFWHDVWCSVGVQKGEEEDPLGQLEHYLQPKNQGGRGIWLVGVLNKALLSKLLWKYGVEGTFLWKRVLQAKYGKERFGWSCRWPSGLTGCCLWKGIWSNWVDFFRLVRFKVNKGDRVRFWPDVWCSREPLRDLFPACFSLASSKDGTVAEHLIRLSVFCSWDLKPMRNLNDWEVEEMGRLLDVLDSYTLRDPELEDEMSCVRDEEGGFIVKSMFDNLSVQKPENLLGICARNPFIQLKVAMFVWKLWWDRVPTIDNLIRRGLTTPSWCCLCVLAGESVSHFSPLPMGARALSLFYNSFSVKWVQPESVKTMLACWPS